MNSKLFYCGFTVLFLMISNASFSQNEIDKTNIPIPIFERLTNDLKNYKLDTSAAPNDKITKKIIELRALRGGFNINEAIEYKLAEDKQKAEIPAGGFEKFSAYFTTGEGRRWLDNAVTSIYRQYFTYKELKQLVKFYKTSAGQKMAADFPLIMMKSLAAGEAIKNMNMLNEKSKK